MVSKSSRMKWFAIVILVGIFSLSNSVSVTNAATTNATFSRSSVSYKQDGIQVAAETPRFENGKFGQALMVEEGTQNFLTVNQSSIETDLSGFSTWSQTGQHTISRDASTAWQGSASIKLSNTSVGNNVMAVGTGAQKTAVSSGQAYTFSVHTKSNVTGRAWTVKIHWFDSSGNVIKTDESGWTNTATSWTVQTVTATAPSNAVSASGEVFLSATASGDAVWWDGAQLEKEAFATSWIPGGTTRSPESLAIPTAGVWNKGNWQMDFVFEPTSSQVRPGSWRFLFALGIDASNGYSLVIHPDGRPYLAVSSNGVEYNTYSTLDPVLQVGQKYHLTIRGDGSKMALFINGVVSASGSKPYVEPVGTLPEKMNIGMVSWGARANGLYDDLRISSRARTDQEIANAYNKNIPLPIDADTLYKMDFDNSLQSTVGAIRVTNATFSRSSVSYKRDGTQIAAETPRFENGKFGQALMMEEGTQNLLTANQSSVETDLSGFSTWSQTGQHMISRDASTAWHGSASTKLTNNTAGNNVMAVGTGAQKTVVTGGQTYTFSVHTKSNVTGRAWTVKIHWFDSSGNVIKTDEPGWTNTATSWTVQTVTATAPSNAVSASGEVFLSATASGDAVWWDGAQLEKEAFATSWIPGGTTRSQESLAIPSAGVWNKGNWQLDFVFEPTSSQVRPGSWRFLFALGIDASNGYSLVIHPDGRPYLAVKSNGVEYNTYSTLDPVLQVGQKYHLTIRGDGSKMALLINGVLSASGSKPYVEPVGTLPEKMYIGMASWGARANGLYDDLRISFRARTDQEIANAYNKNVPLPVDADTLYKMDFDNSLQSTVGAIQISPDKYESNDTIGEALNIAQGTLTSYINIFDVDYYKITTPIDGNLIISLKGPTGTNFDLQLLDSNGALLQSSNGDGPNELISQALSKSNTYYIKVYGVNDAFSLIPYQLELNYPYEYVYDASNRLDFINLLSGKLIDYQYDNNGNLIQSIKR